MESPWAELAIRIRKKRDGDGGEDADDDDDDQELDEGEALFILLDRLLDASDHCESLQDRENEKPRRRSLTAPR